MCTVQFVVQFHLKNRDFLKQTMSNVSPTKLKIVRLARVFIRRPNLNCCTMSRRAREVCRTAPCHFHELMIRI